MKAQMYHILVLPVFRYLKRRQSGRGNVTKQQPKIIIFHGLESHERGVTTR